MPRTFGCRSWTIALLTGAAISISAPASGQERTTVFGGVNFGEDEGAYLGATFTPPGGRIGQGWGLRTTVSGSQYEYETNGVEISGEEVRAEAAILHQWSGAWGYVDVGVGARYVNTELSPQDPGNERGGVQWSPTLSATAQRVAGPWRLEGFASTGLGDEDYFVRGEVTRAVGPTVRLGVEAAMDGDPNYERQRVGAVVSFAPAETWEVQFVAGALYGDNDDGAYGGISFSRRF